MRFIRFGWGGAFTIGNTADMLVLIAGGVGIPPMMSIVRMLPTAATRGL